MSLQMGFDPLGDLLVAQNSKPNQLGNINLRTLSAFQRALLVIDGTVTKFIEAYTMEPVDVSLLDQKTQALESDHIWLEAPKGTPVIMRQVLLRGRRTGVFHAYAVSLLVISRLPPSVQADLNRNPGGIGRVLLESRLETRREVLWYGRENLTAMPEELEKLSDGRFMSRTYRVIADGHPMMLINEKFPLESGDPEHH